MQNESSKEKLLNELRQTELRTQLALGIPHLYGWRFYPWAREFHESTNRVNILCAANQVGKSTANIRKCIDWATDKKKWPKLWAHTPRLFFYLYPGQAQVNVEFETKWVQFLPRNGYENDQTYGFRVERDGRDIKAIHFNSQIHVYFKTYFQNAQALQSSTCDAIFADEEIPANIFPELQFRLAASAGYFHLVMTPTLGQEIWRKCLEPRTGEEEFLPNAWKKTVSMYDCLTYDTGEKSHWSIEKIQEIKASCNSDIEVQKRIHGRFIALTGRIFHSYDPDVHLRPKHILPKNWYIYSGVDIGSGNPNDTDSPANNFGHKSAIVFVAVRPDFRAGRVFLGWRGDGISTTAGDVVEKYLKLKKENILDNMNGEYYDFASKDFLEISNRMGGSSFQGADKGIEKGTEIVNTLFRNNMLLIYDDMELLKLSSELQSVLHTTTRIRRRDDFVSALRYAVSRVPWDFSCVMAEIKVDLEDMPERPLTEMQLQVQERRKRFDEAEEIEKARLDQEFSEINEAYGGY